MYMPSCCKGKSGRHNAHFLDMYEQVVCLSAAGSPEDLDEKRVRGKERRGGEAGPAYRVKMEGGGEEWGRILEAGTKHGEEGRRGRGKTNQNGRQAGERRA